MPARRQSDEHDHSVHSRCLLAVGALIAVFGGISARLVFVQHVQHEKWSAQMNSNRREPEVLPAARGPIFDTKFRLLACDEMVESVVFDNVYLNEKISKGAMQRMASALASVEQRPWVEIKRGWSDEELKKRYVWWVANTIAQALGKSPQEVSKAILERTNSKGERLPDNLGETVLAKEITATQAGDLKAIMGKNPLACVHVKTAFRRSYPTTRPLTHLVGLINAHGPVCGVEAARQDVMKGEPGHRVFEVDGVGNEVAAFRGDFVEPKQGRGLKLTLDTALQEIVEQALDETGSDPEEIYVPALKAKRVSVLILDAKTMAIRADACRREDLKDGAPLLFNPAAQEPYEPGSTMKVMTVAAALDTGKVDPSTIISTNSGYYDDADIEPIHDDHGYPQLSVTDILVHSSNIGAYKLARTVGLKRFRDYISSFGFGARTGVECANESPGILHPVAKWNYNAMSRASYGYGVAVTPVQMCAALGVIVNDGIYKQPHLVEAVLEPGSNRVLEEGRIAEPRRVISSRAAKATREALYQVVERGTGKKAQSKDYEIAGKTGTARLADKGGYATGQYIVSFLGYAPASNPQFVGLVVVDTPQGEAQSLYGGKLAAPLFRRIMEACLRYYQIPAGEVAHNARPTRR